MIAGLGRHVPVDVIGPPLVLVTALLLLACGSSSAAGPVGAPRGQQAAIAAETIGVTEVNATGMGGAFSPATVSIRAGDQVEWTNKSGNIHNVTFSTPEAHSPVMFAGDRWSQAFPTAGTFHYVCTYHPGMEGSVVVR